LRESSLDPSPRL